MSARSGDFHTTLYALLPLHIRKIEFREIQAFIKFFFGVYDGLLQRGALVKEIHHFFNIVYAIHFQIIYNSGLPCIFIG